MNFSPGTMDKLGLGKDELLKLNPPLIYASLSAFGQTGPLRDYPGFDPIAQAMGGMTIASALLHKTKTGEGQTIDISMQDCIWQKKESLVEMGTLKNIWKMLPAKCASSLKIC